MKEQSDPVQEGHEEERLPPAPDRVNAWSLSGHALPAADVVHPIRSTHGVIPGAGDVRKIRVCYYVVDIFLLHIYSKRKVTSSSLERMARISQGLSE